MKNRKFDIKKYQVFYYRLLFDDTKFKDNIMAEFIIFIQTL